MKKRIIAPESLAFSKNLGSGGFADVYSGKYDGAKCAIKVLRKNGNEDDKEARKNFETESEILFTIRHPHVIQTFGFCRESPKGPAIVLERCECDLRKYVKKLTDTHNSPKIISLLLQAATGLNHLHDYKGKDANCKTRRTTKNVYHGDVKPENFLVVQNIRPLMNEGYPGNKRSYSVEVTVKLADFGGVAASGDPIREYTKEYAAPEVLQSELDDPPKGTEPPSCLSDTYSFSCMSIQLLENDMKTRLSSLLSRVTGGDGVTGQFGGRSLYPWGLSEHSAEKVADLLERGMSTAPKVRPLMEEVVQSLASVCSPSVHMDPDTLTDSGGGHEGEAEEGRERKRPRKGKLAFAKLARQTDSGKTKKLKVIRRRFEGFSPFQESTLLHIEIVPGWKAGTKITFAGEGDVDVPGGVPRDIVFVLKEKPHARFQRVGDDLHARVPVPAGIGEVTDSRLNEV
uniref:Protein kinase domain-containing protein n=1 Tax=Chromera velia CCMP2878 TaxID=1169474 RepID=A0A0G4FG16_9ALVE|eukprot:Cvel_16783.t1-p1 / transcript=Cvel_16783.t1 / gene=Cvel_16783 / organism=Chromera_velia_CCMP2878 / gene_product=Serine/threonine-protein kinase ATG1, putative / transcript_product=Serine/threonine-protein kinase ATG1, putative / location=Cvel_scaffold1309:45010-48269(-) / protein_length=456 / sequence_SO=supercontig / SO=protein_coding / is_pseudo=false